MLQKSILFKKNMGKVSAPSILFYINMGKLSATNILYLFQKNGTVLYYVK